MRVKRFGNLKFLVLGLVVFALLASFSVQSAHSKTRVVVAQGVDPTRLDPDMHRETPSNNVILHIYDALVERDWNAKIQPDLAETWKIINDTTMEFKLRKGIKFSNGEPFNAEVVNTYGYKLVRNTFSPVMSVHPNIVDTPEWSFADRIC